MKAEDLKTKTTDELNKILMDTRKEQFNQRFQRSNGALEKTATIRNTRRMIARIKTFLSQKTATETSAAAPKAKKTTAAKKPAAKKTTKTKAA